MILVLIPTSIGNLITYLFIYLFIYWDIFENEYFSQYKHLPNPYLSVIKILLRGGACFL